MSFLDDMYGAYTKYSPTGMVIGSLTGDQARPHSDIPNADRNNYNLPGSFERGGYFNGQMETAHDPNQRGANLSGNNSGFRNYQNDLAARLSRQVNGEESLSRLQLQDATNNSMAQQRSMAASASPGNTAMAQRLAMQQQGAANQGFGHQAAMLGIQERNAAANALGGLSTAARGQDLQNNQFNAGMQAQNRAQNDQYGLGMGQLALGNAMGQQRGGMAYEENQTNRRGQDLNIPPPVSPGERIMGGLEAVAPYALAKGGIVTQPTHAIIGEAGPEAVIPLQHLPELIARLQQSVNHHAGMVAGRTKMAAPDPRAEQVRAATIQERLKSPVSVVSHERDPIRERPFQASAQAENAQRAANEAQGQADYLRRFASQNYGVNR